MYLTKMESGVKSNKLLEQAMMIVKERWIMNDLGNRKETWWLNIDAQHQEKRGKNPSVNYVIKKREITRKSKILKSWENLQPRTLKSNHGKDLIQAKAFPKIWKAVEEPCVNRITAWQKELVFWRTGSAKKWRMRCNRPSLNRKASGYLFNLQKWQSANSSMSKMKN